MASKLADALIRFGTVPPKAFGQAGGPGDWQDFDVTLPGPVPMPARIILTASNAGVAEGEVAAPVPYVAERIVGGGSLEGFKVRARNADCAPGQAGFNWLALGENGNGERQLLDVRLGRAQDRLFWRWCTPWLGYRRGWFVEFDRPFAAGTTPRVFLVAGAVNAAQPPSAGPGNAAAVVPVAESASPQSFLLRGLNSDCAAAPSGFHWLALAEGAPAPSPLAVDSGEATTDFAPIIPALPDWFSPGCNEGDWHYGRVDFHRPFATPPIVLVSADGVKASAFDERYLAAVVPTVREVTRQGFTLAVRNSDLTAGYMIGYHWVAVGCADECP
jgi:H-type lectin domain